MCDIVNQTVPLCFKKSVYFNQHCFNQQSAGQSCVFSAVTYIAETWIVNTRMMKKRGLDTEVLKGLYIANNNDRKQTSNITRLDEL